MTRLRELVQSTLRQTRKRDQPHPARDSKVIAVLHGDLSLSKVYHGGYYICLCVTDEEHSSHGADPDVAVFY